ncbi:MAG TPA: iron ABC transporter permease [Actinomycetota bacterium]|nr:iron ABC transporter permease [Actinomycetota bacterium]
MATRVDAAAALAERSVRRRSAGFSRPPPKAVAAGAVVVALVVLLPTVYIIVRASEGGAHDFISTLADGTAVALLLRTMALAAAVTAGALVIGVPLAWLTTRTDLPGRRVFAVLTALPLVIPTYVGGYAFVAALGPRGLAQGLLAPLGVERLPEIYGFFGAWLVLTLFTYPYVLLTVRAAVRRLDPALEEAGRALGRTDGETFRRIVLPQLRPAATAGGLLVALYTIHDFGAVSLLRYDTFTRSIYVSYQGSFDRSRAAVLSLVLVALTIVVIALESRIRGRAAYFRSHASAPRQPRVRPLGRKRWPAFAACSALVSVALLLPLSVISYWMIQSARQGAGIGRTLSAALNSVEASSLGAVLAVAAAWPIAVMTVRFPGRLARATERASYTGYALPGLVVALSLVFFGIRAAPALYQTLVLLVFAYIVLFIPQAEGPLRASLLQLNPALEEASHSLGAGRYRTMGRIVLPLIRPGIAAGIALVFLTAMKELPATLLLAPTGFRTLATEVWSATSASYFDRAALPALAIVLASSIPLAVLMFRERETR